MNVEELDALVWDIWKQDLDTKAVSTMKAYRRDFKSFLERWNTTAGQLYEMRKADFTTTEPLERKRIERMVKTSMSELLKKGYAAGTCKSVRNAVSSFFESMDMELRFKKKDMPKGEPKGQMVITASQIRKIYDQMIYGWSLRNRSILLTGKDNGLRVSDLRMMNYGHLLKAETILNEYGETFKVFDPEHTLKMKVIAYIHLGPESVAAIAEYLEYRQDGGEILTEESPLFLGEDGERITRNALSTLFWRKARRLRLKRISAHSLRKFHRTRFQGAGMDNDWINKLQGKKTDPYTRPEDDISEKYPGFNMLTERYIDNYDVLRVFETPTKKGETERLREEVERLRAQSDPEISKLWIAYKDIQDTVIKIANAMDIPV